MEPKLNNMLRNNGIIQDESDSSYSNPLIVVKNRMAASVWFIIIFV